MTNQTGILLINLGTPRSSRFSDVRRYLTEFLTDKRVMDLPWLWRQILVRGWIIPSRCRQSAQSYAKIWTEEGSPLLVHSLQTARALQENLGDEFHVEIAMRYQKPSIEEKLTLLMKKQIKKLVVVPLFPQYASATTGSIHQNVMTLLSRYELIPEVKFIQQFAAFPPFIEALCSRIQHRDLNSYDHILFSFHGLPQSQIKKADRTGMCLRQSDCCQSRERQTCCYAAQCFATTEAIVKKLNLPPDHYSLSFQSRLGKDPWLQPYTSETIHQLAKQEKKRVLVFCPSFVCDCLETIYEIGIEYAAEFRQAGGETLELVPGLNNHPEWIHALKELVNPVA